LAAIKVALASLTARRIAEVRWVCELPVVVELLLIAAEPSRAAIGDSRVGASRSLVVMEQARSILRLCLTVRASDGHQILVSQLHSRDGGVSALGKQQRPSACKEDRRTGWVA
jgi:hypothetical protein